MIHPPRKVWVTFARVGTGLQPVDVQMTPECDGWRRADATDIVQDYDCSLAKLEVLRIARDAIARPYYNRVTKDDAGTDWLVALERIVELLDDAKPRKKRPKSASAKKRKK